MPRRKAAIKREIHPDPLYRSGQIAKFINVIMTQGKKSIAEKIVYHALESLVLKAKKGKDEEDSGEGSKGTSGGKTAATKGKVKSKNLAADDVLEALKKSLMNVAPTVEVKSRRVGGATYQVPIEVVPERGMALAMRWIAASARKRSEKTMALRLAAELQDAYLGRGAAIKIRDDVHRMAKANQAFAHYRW